MSRPPLLCEEGNSERRNEDGERRLNRGKRAGMIVGVRMRSYTRDRPISNSSSRWHRVWRRRPLLPVEGTVIGGCTWRTEADIQEDE